MTAADEAIHVADQIIAGIPAFIHQTVQERRKQACWLFVRASVRAKKARAWAGRNWWSYWAGVHDANCTANLTVCAEIKRRLAAMYPEGMA